MAVTFGLVASAAQESVVNTIELSITPGSDSDMVLVAFHAVNRTTFRSGSVIYDPAGANVAFTSLGSITHPTSNYDFEAYILLDANIVNGVEKTIRGVVASSGTARQSLIVASFSGVDQATAVAHAVASLASAASTATSFSSVVSSATGNLVVDGVMVVAESPTVGAGQTQQGAVTQSANYARISTEAGAASTAMSWATSGSRQHAQLAFSLPQVADDSTAPTLVSAAINIEGDQLVLTFNENVVGTDSDGLVLTGEEGSLVATYESGTGTTALAFDLNRTVYDDEVVTLDYAPGNIEDTSANALASISDFAVTNNSTAPLPTFTYQHIKNGVDIPGETSAVLTIDPTDTDDSGSYSIRITSTVTGQSVTIPLPEPVVVT